MAQRSQRVRKATDHFLPEYHGASDSLVPAGLLSSRLPIVPLRDRAEP